MVFPVKDGRRVRFWKDKRCNDETLCVSFLFCMPWRFQKRHGVEVWNFISISISIYIKFSLFSQKNLKNKK